MVGWMGYQMCAVSGLSSVVSVAVISANVRVALMSV
jgi:hypothetical protein